MAGPVPRSASSGRRRTLALAAAAAALSVLTFYDYTRGLGDRSPERTLRTARPAGPAALSPALVTPALPSSAEARAGYWNELRVLRHLRDHATDIRQRYQAIAVPYAEAVAGFSTLYPAGRAPREQAAQAIRDMLPPDVELKDLLLADMEPSRSGVTWLTATISLTSADSQAMARALLRLGAGAGGMAWKELSAGVDSERRIVNARGQLAMLMVPQAE